MLGLDILRGVAALLVFFHHAVIWGGMSFGPLTELARGGRIGVLVFFALSGFVIGRRVLPGVDLGHYMAGRAVRLLPAYYFALVGMIVLSVVVGSGPPDLLPYLFVLSGHTADGSAFFSQAWTLTVEMEFYLLVPFIIGIRGPLLLLLGGVSAVLAVVPLHLGVFDFLWAFLPGMALARVEWSNPGLFRRLTSRPALVAGVGLTSLMMLLNPDPLVGIVATPAVLLLIGGCAGRTVPARFHGAARWSGDLSYPFYLWHQYPVALFGMAGGFVVAFSASITSVVLVERPSQHWFARRSRRRVAPAEALAASPAAHAAVAVGAAPGAVAPVTGPGAPAAA